MVATRRRNTWNTTPCLLHLLACEGSLWAHCVMQVLIILPCLQPGMIGTMRSV